MRKFLIAAVILMGCEAPIEGGKTATVKGQFFTYQITWDDAVAQVFGTGDEPAKIMVLPSATKLARYDQDRVSAVIKATGCTPVGDPRPAVSNTGIAGAVYSLTC